MRGILHIPADEKVNATTPLIDQGVDSLGAITVGSWLAFVHLPSFQDTLADVCNFQVFQDTHDRHPAAEGCQWCFNR